MMVALIDSANDAISKTLNGVITSWNKGAQRIFGYSAPEAIGQPIFILIPLTVTTKIQVLSPEYGPENASSITRRCVAAETVRSSTSR
jgi:PAS domain S-box-containing protein